MLDILAMYLDYTIDRGFNLLGYNSPQGTREHGTNKTTAEDLKIREYVNTNEPMYFFNNCLLVYNKGNKHDNTPAYHLFVNPNNLKISGRDKTLFPNLI